MCKDFLGGARFAMATAYQKSCLEFASSLDKNKDAFNTLHCIYKLPAGYTHLPASATVQAMEMLGIFSADSASGLVDLPLVVGMKDKHKWIKRKMKGKVRYTGFKGIIKADPRLDQMMATAEETAYILQSQLQLIEMTLSSHYGTDNAMEEALDELDTVKKTMNDSFGKISSMSKSLDGVHDQHLLDGNIQRKDPVHFVRRKPGGSKPTPDVPPLQPGDEDRSRMTFDRLPTPTSQRKNRPKQQWSPVLNRPGNEPLPEEKQVRSKSWESSSGASRQQTSQLAMHSQQAATNHTLGGTAKTNSNPTFVEELKHLQVDEPTEVKSSSPRPAPPTKPKPNRTGAGSKVPLLPPLPAINNSTEEDNRLSAEYISMNPVGNEFPKTLPISVATPPQTRPLSHQYVNVGVSNNKSQTALLGGGEDPEDECYEYEYF